MKCIKCKHYIESASQKEEGSFYPHKIFACVLLLNNKIDNWWVVESKMEDNLDAADFLKIKVDGNCRILRTCWNVETLDERDAVLSKLAANWFAKWLVMDGFKGFKPY
ncbi:hypothetical protein ABDB91_15530 [Desulfoscipio sp. XC116]|uniref:hypothetical protein n=1 Tax=Desulfoscipio sp. XC116 TaxID=3144975 RepID=UPI00325B2E56